MKPPLWLINSFLLVLLLCVVGFVLFTRQSIPKKKPLEPEATAVVLPKKEVPKIQLNRIYQNDLFATYIPTTTSEPEEIQKPMLPMPPTPKKFVPVPITEPTFLAELKIVLKGIIWQSEEQSSHAMIADQTGKQKLYKVGDKIEDGYIIRIFERKIIILRSNGQQDIIYLNKEEAEKDKAQELERKKDFELIIKKTAENNFIIDPEKFVSLVQDLSTFLDALKLSSVHKDGKGFGLRVGSLESTSLGTQLGLQTNDIITTINTIPATDTKNRVEIYNSIVSLEDGKLIEVKIRRNRQEKTLHYQLQKIVQNDLQKAGEERRAILDRYQKMVPTISNYQKNDKHIMLNKGTKKPLFKIIT